ncbi:uncharacterized protein LOC110978770 [Acanthaster planci]|uniref:Uncharacterized protein LOC110978770 n=1 Tax=Acanthaster planci TaxID=133434 RepID=A0A8B7YAZ0_ACAPL|nr:uncharacterized protein LOC110978770 [Acanthaster planci]
MAAKEAGNDLEKGPLEERPLYHFAWNLKIGVEIDCDKIIRKIDEDLDKTPRLLGIEALLFRAYLEVCDNRKRWNVRKAREFLDKADVRIEQTDERLRKGYKVVSLLNRMWIENKCLKTQKVKELRAKLDGKRLEKEDHLVIRAVKAAALTRLGPNVYAMALDMFEKALEKFPENVNFLYGAALMAGRMARYRRITTPEYERLDPGGQKLLDKEKDYLLKMMEINDEYQLARSALGSNLIGRRGKQTEGLGHLKMAYEEAPQVQEVVLNLVRYYRRESRMVDQATDILKNRIEENPDCNESHYQLALCYLKHAKECSAEQERDEWNGKALAELEQCLELNKGHTFAMIHECQVTNFLKEITEAEELYENCMQQSEHWTSENKFHLYFEFAWFLDKNQTATGHNSRMDLWQKVMDLTASFEFLDETSCKWEVEKKEEGRKETAYKKLLDHYKSNSLELGILHFQNFKFEEAEKVLENLPELEREANFDIPRYLALTYLKMGYERELLALSQGGKPEEAKGIFKKAHENAIRAMEIGLSQTDGRKLRADTALAIAHNQLLLSTPTTIQLDSLCIRSYREAVRCGSLVASLELLRLIQNNSVQVTSRWTFLQMLAEIVVCCSLRSSDCLHKDQKPLTFEHGLSSRDTDKDVSALNCKTIKRDGRAILDGSPFFRPAWEQHFCMEKKILTERFENNEGELELDGREELEEITSSNEIIRAAADCCLKLRPLLDGIVDKFRREEVGRDEETKKQYFPLILDEQNARKMQSELKKRLTLIFGIDVDRNYPKLWNQLLKTQPCCNSGNEFLKTFYTLVNKIKHSDVASSESNLLIITKDPVTLARQCTDKVEEICNFFFDAMREATHLRNRVEQLVSDIKDGRHEKADELLKILSSKEDFVVRMGSTWNLLEMTALIRQSKRLSRSPDVEAEEALRKLTEGPQGICHNLRRHHQEVEDAVLENHEDDRLSAKCRETCKEAVKALDAELAKHKTLSGDGSDPQSTEVTFPLLDMCPDEETPGHWTGKVTKQLRGDLKQMGILVKTNKKLVEIILQAQPCVSEKNYRFIAVKTFISEGSNDGMVKIKTDSGDDKSFKMLDLTRWCTNKTEKVLLGMQSCLLLPPS